VVAGKDEGDAGLSGAPKQNMRPPGLLGSGMDPMTLRERNEVTTAAGISNTLAWDVAAWCEEELHEAEEAAQNKGHWEIDPAGVGTACPDRLLDSSALA